MNKGRTCPNCGAALMPGDIFCGECGARPQASDYDAAPDASFADVPPITAEEPLAEEETGIEPPIGEYIPPPVSEKASNWNTLRIIIVVAAVGFLLLSLCLCSLGGLMLIPTDSTTAEEDQILAVLCFMPGVISCLLGIGAAYFGFRKR